jgi:AcrR family transcriptional regulator
MLGLSQMAVYRHFQDMEDLLAHAWDRAFGEMLQAVNAALTDEDPKEDFRQGLLAYVSWGLANPGLYRLMHFIHFDRFEVLQNQVTSLRGLEILRDRIQKCIQAQGASVGPEELHCMALQSYFTVHGLTTVAISGRMQRISHVQPEELAGNLIDRLCDSFSVFQNANATALRPSNPGHQMGEIP